MEHLHSPESFSVDDQRKRWISLLSSWQYSFNTLDFQTEGTMGDRVINLNKSVVTALEKLPVHVNKELTLSTSEYADLDP